MSSESGHSGRKKDHGPQGTQVFSREEVSDLIGQAADDDFAGSGAELTGISAAISGRSFALSSSRVLVGRGDSCDLTLDDSSVSSEHARLVRDTDGGWRVVNLLSTNGTFVNDRKVSSSGLADGDRVRFGRVELRFHDPEGQAGGGGTWQWWPWAAAAAGVVVVVVAVIWLL